MATKTTTKKTKATKAAKTTKKTGKATKQAKTRKAKSVVTEQSAPGMPILVNGKTLGEIGREVGVSASYMSRLKRGKRAPSIAVLDKLVVATGLTMDQVREVFAPVGQGEVAYGQVQTTTKKGKKAKGAKKGAKKAKAAKKPSTQSVAAARRAVQREAIVFKKAKAKPAPKARKRKAPEVPEAVTRAISLIPSADDDGETFADPIN